MNSDEVFKELIDAIILFEDADVTALDKIINIHEKLMMKEPSGIPHRLNEFVRLLSERPAIELESFRNLQSPELRSIASAPLTNGKELIEKKKSWTLGDTDPAVVQLEAEQTGMLYILIECRKMEDSEAAQEIYTRIRLFIYNPAFEKQRLSSKPYVNVITEKQKEVFINDLATTYKLSVPFVRRIENIYDKVDLKEEMTVCPVCYALKADPNHCTDPVICFSDKRKYRRDEDRAIENLLKYNSWLKTEADVESSTFYRPKAGIFKYIVLPGLSELRIAKMLERRLPVEVSLFPEIERAGDIKVSYGDRVLFLDVKDHRNPQQLGQSLMESGKSLPPIVIASHRTRENKMYMDLLKHEIEGLVLLKEREVVKYVTKHFGIPERLVRK